MSLSGIVNQVATVNNTPAISSGATALEANGRRISWGIKNLSATDALFVRFGSGASSSLFHEVLAPGTTQDLGDGGAFQQNGGSVYTGIVTIAGTSPRYCVYEFVDGDFVS